MVTDLPLAALFISGTVGAGKTTTADAIGDLLAGRGVPGAVIDLDWLRRCWPSPPGDRFNGGVELANLTAVAGTYRRAGARRLVLAGVLEDPAARPSYERAVGVPLVVCRLRVDLAVVRRRLHQRHVGEDAVLAWHLHRSGELDAILDTARAEDVTVDATDLTVPEAAEAVVRAAGWDADQGVPPGPRTGGLRRCPS